MKDISRILAKLQVSTDGISVYMLLLKRGVSSMSEIAHLGELHRPRAYEVIRDLAEKELVVVVTRGKRTFYEAASPRRLRYMVGSLAEEIESVIPQLETLQSTRTDAATHVEQLSGRQGLAYAFMDVVDSLAKGDVFYRIGAERDQKTVDSYVPREYRALRDKKQLERLVITSKRIGSAKKARMERTIRLIGEGDELFENNVIQFIYGNKMSLLDFNTEKAIIIENEAMAAFQKKLFLTLYKHLPQL